MLNREKEGNGDDVSMPTPESMPGQEVVHRSSLHQSFPAYLSPPSLEKQVEALRVTLAQQIVAGQDDAIEFEAIRRSLASVLDRQTNYNHRLTGVLVEQAEITEKVNRLIAVIEDARRNFTAVQRTQDLKITEEVNRLIAVIDDARRNSAAVQQTQDLKITEEVNRLIAVIEDARRNFTAVQQTQDLKIAKLEMVNNLLLGFFAMTVLYVCCNNRDFLYRMCGEIFSKEIIAAPALVGLADVVSNFVNETSSFVLRYAKGEVGLEAEMLV